LEDWRRLGVVTLICGQRQSALELLRTLGEVTSVEPASVTEIAFGDVPATSTNEVLQRLAGRSLLFDLETLCWSPWLHLDPVRLLREHARSQGVLAVWPGTVSGRTATFSAPDRRDYVTADVRGLSVLRAVPTRFPDEVPFVIERISA
jgi:hypothetical protein